MLQSFNEVDWVENFRMSQTTFNALCLQLRPSIEQQTTKLRRPISVEKRLAVTLWFLSTTAEYCTIAHLFGIARSTVCEIVHETSAAIVYFFLNTYIRFPVGDKLQDVVGALLKLGCHDNIKSRCLSIVQIGHPIEVS